MKVYIHKFLYILTSKKHTNNKDSLAVGAISTAVCFLGINKMDKLTPRGRLACQRFAGKALGIKHQGEEGRKQEGAGGEAGL